MDILYTVDANFSDWESSWSIRIGIFTNKDIADLVKNKWNSFFNENKSILNQPVEFKSIDDEEWEYSDEKIELENIYSEILHFDGITIKEEILNKEVYSLESNNTFRSKKMFDLIKCWERNYKLNNIINE